MKVSANLSGRRCLWAFLLLGLLGLALPLGCSGGDDTKARPGTSGSATERETGPAKAAGPRVLLIGVDGAEWNVIQPLIDRGDLPNFARFRNEGATGPLESLAIMLSPIIWTSVATGKTADKHGIGWFMADNPKTGKRIPIQSRHRKVKAIWNILGEADRTPGIIGWWATWPAEEVGKGFIVSDYLGFHGFGVTGRNRKIDSFLTYPDVLTAEVRPMIPEPDTITYEEIRQFMNIDEAEFQEARDLLLDPKVEDSYKNPVTHFMRYLATMKGYEAIGLRLWKERDPDLMAVYFEQVDSTGHLFMKYAPPKQEWVDDEKFAKFSGTLEAMYKHQDRILGRYLDAAGPDTVVVLVSDHGFLTGEARPTGMEDVDALKAAQEHRRYGVLAALGPGIRRGAEVRRASVLDITPTLLYLLGEPVARDMDGRVLVEMFSESFTRTHAMQTVESYEADVLARAASEPIDVDADMASAEEERLRALGYLSDEPEESSPEVHNNLAMILLQKQEVTKAIEEFRKALRLDPTNAGTHAGLATAFARQGRIDDARRELEIATRIDPDNPMTLTSLGNLNLELRQIDEARAAFERALEKDPSFVLATVGVASSYSMDGDWQRARELFEAALAKHPRDPVLLYNLGRAYKEIGDVEGAIAKYHETVRLAPDFWPAHNNLGDIYQQQGRLDDAIAEFEAVVQGDPTHMTSRYNLGTVLMHRGTREALETQSRISSNIARLEQEKAKSEPSAEEIERLERAIAEDRERLPELDRERKEMLGRAVELFKEVISMTPELEYAHNNLALTYYYLGDTMNCVRTYDRMTKLFPKSPQPWLQTAFFSMMNGKADEAKRRLREAFAAGGNPILAEARKMPVFQPLDLDAIYAEATGIEKSE